MANTEAKQEAIRRWQQKYGAEYLREYRKKYPERTKEYDRISKEKNSETIKLKKNIRNVRRRMEILNAYGNKCACCGESNYEFLGIDHINNNGSQHRKEIGRGLYDFLIKNNFPSEFQILCHNCNFAKGHYGYCPHTQTENRIIERLRGSVDKTEIMNR